MKVIVKQSAGTLTIRQPSTRSHRLLRLVAWLLAAMVMAAAVYEFGTSASLSCAREPGSGVVCTERLDWLGSFARSQRYERVEQAAVPIKLSPGRNVSADLQLQTADGIVEFPALHRNAYADWDAPINAFIQQPGAAPLVLRDPPNVLGVLISATLLLLAAYQCLVMPLRNGLITIFDARQGQGWLHQQGFWRPKTYRLRLAEVSRVYAESTNAARVYLTAGRQTLEICSFSFDARQSGAEVAALAEARALAANINAWLALGQQRPLNQPRESQP